ncbi:MAG: glycosyltransferase family 39 protein [Planctomycetes bacterium]|nr:glycosyltransferase family 39 protein [Planctomycetota bacterium]
MSACVGVGLVLRMTGLGLHSLWFDEIATVHVMSAADLVEALKDDRHPPLLFWLLKPWQSWFGNTEAALRALPAVIGCLGLAVFASTLGVLARSGSMGHAAALQAVAVFAISPFSIWYAQELRAHSLLELCGVLAMASMVAADAGRRRLAFALAAVALALGVGSHYMAGMLVPAAVAVGWLRWRRGLVAWRNAFAPTAGALLGFAVWIPWLVTMLPIQCATPWPALGRTGLRDLAELPARLVLSELSGLGMFGSGCAVAAAACIYLGLAGSVARGRRRAGFATSALVAAAAQVGTALALALVVAPNFLPRYLAGAAPFVLVAVGCGLAALRPRVLAGAAAGVLLASCAVIVGTHRVHGGKQDWRGAFAAVVATWQPGDRVGVLMTPFPGFAEAPARYYLRDCDAQLRALVPTAHLEQPDGGWHSGARLHLVVYDASWTAERCAALCARGDVLVETRVRKNVRRLLLQFR